MKKLFLALLFMCVALAASATTRYVSNAAVNGTYVIGTDSGSGLTPATAYLTINYAITQSSDGDTITVNPSGTPYAESTTGSTLQIAHAVTLQGDPAYVVRGVTYPVIQVGGSYNTVVIVANHASNLIDIGIDAQSGASRTGIQFSGDGTHPQTSTGLVILNMASTNNAVLDTTANTSLTMDKTYLRAADGNSTNCTLFNCNSASAAVTFTGLTMTTGIVTITNGTLQFDDSGDGTHSAISSVATGGQIINASSTTTGGNIYFHNCRFGSIPTTAHFFFEGSGNTLGTISSVGCVSTTNIPAGKSWFRVTGTYTNKILQNNTLGGSATGTTSNFTSSGATQVGTSATITGNVLTNLVVDERGAVTSGVFGTKGAGNQLLGTIPVTAILCDLSGWQSNWTHDYNVINMTNCGAAGVVQAQPSGGFEASFNNIITDSQPSAHQIYAGYDGRGSIVANTAGSQSDLNLGDTTADTHVACSFTYTTAYNVDKFIGALEVQLKSQGSPTGNIDCYFYSDNSGQPGSILFHSDWTLATTGYSSSYLWQEFLSYARYACTPGSKYWIDLKASAISASNYIKVLQTNTVNPTGYSIKTSSDGSTWTGSSTNTFYFQATATNLSCVQPYMHDNRIDTYNNQSAMSGFTHGLVLGNTDGGYIVRNYVTGIGIACLLKMVDGSVHQAVMADNIAYSYLGSTIQMFLSKGSINAKVVHNVAISGGKQTPFGAYGDTPTGAGGGTFYNTTPDQSPVFENNIGILTATANPLDMLVLGLPTYQGPTLTSPTFDHNVWYTAPGATFQTGYALVNTGTTGSQTTYASFGAYSSGASLDTHTLTTSPQLGNQVAPASFGDFVPAATSPALGLGVNTLGASPTDYLNVNFPVLTPDAGAFSIAAFYLAPQVNGKVLNLLSGLSSNVTNSLAALYYAAYPSVITTANSIGVPPTTGTQTTFVDSTAGTITITLPTAVGHAGAQVVTDWKGQANAHAIYVATVWGQLINRAASPFAMTSVGQSTRWVSDGANWILGVNLSPSIRVVTAAGALTLLPSDNGGTVVLNKGTPATTAVSLASASFQAGYTVTIKDGGQNSGTYAITLTPTTGTIEGASSYVINSNGKSVMVQFDGTNWWVI